MGIQNLSPHLLNSAILRTTKSIVELRTKKVSELRLWTFKIGFRNSATLPSLLPIPLLSDTFFSVQDGFKNQSKIFIKLSVSLETKNLP
jgi:hypothetical protein